MIPWRIPRSTIAARPAPSSRSWARRPSAQRWERSPRSSMVVTWSGAVTGAPLGLVTVTLLGDSRSAVRPTTSRLSSARRAPRSRGKMRSTVGPRSIEAPRRAGRSACSSSSSAARAASLPSPMRTARAPRASPWRRARSARSPTPRPKMRTGRGSLARRVARSPSEASPTVGTASPMYTTAPRRCGSSALAASPSIPPRSVAPPGVAAASAARIRRRTSASTGMSPGRSASRGLSPVSPAQAATRSPVPRCASSAAVAARAIESEEGSVAAEVSTTMARSSPPAGAGRSPGRSLTST